MASACTRATFGAFRHTRQEQSRRRVTMPSMPYYFLGKGSQFAMLDQQFGGNDFMSQYDAALARLEGTTARPLSDLADAHSDPSSGLQQGLTGNDAQHFRDHWLDNVGGWWANTHTEAVLRTGLVEAIR